MRSEWIRALRFGLPVFLLVAALVLAFAARIQYSHVQDRNHQLRLALDGQSDQVEAAFNQSATATRIMAFLMEEGALTARFDSVSGALLARSTAIDALQLVHQGVITNTFPLEGNEVTIGFRVMDEVVNRVDAMKALERQGMFVQGPLTLRQGGTGFVARYPYFDRQGRHAGFTAAIVRKETLIRAIGLDSMGVSGPYRFELKSINGEGHPRWLFENGVQQLASDSIAISYGDWVLYAEDTRPMATPTVWVVLLLGGLLAVGLGVLSGVLAASPVVLRRRVEQQTHALRIANAELRQIAHVTSHDLQEPVRVITTHVQRLEERLGGALPPQAKAHMDVIVENTRRLRQFVLDLAYYTEPDAQTDRIRPTDLNAMLNRIAHEATRLAGVSIHTVRYPHLPVLPLPAIAVESVLRGLVINGLTFRHPDREPEVRISVEEYRDHIAFAVADNGIGIDPAYFNRIFDLFQRLRSEGAGTGVGLPIAKKWVESAGGRIWVESEPDKGSTFHFTIPKSHFSHETGAHPSGRRQ